MAFPYGNDPQPNPPPPGPGMPGNGNNGYPVSGGFPGATGTAPGTAPPPPPPTNYGGRNFGSPPTDYGNFGQPTAQNAAGAQGDPFPRQVDISQHQMDPRYLERMRDIAFDDPGQSPWLRYQMDQDRERQAGDRDMLSSRGSSNMATQQGNMAMRGGLTSGATERLGRQNLMSQLMGQQDLSRAAAGREGAYRQQAEERQRNVLTQLPQAELGYSQYGADLDKFNVEQWNQAEAARREADAIGDQGGSDSSMGWNALKSKTWDYDREQMGKGRLAGGGKYGVNMGFKKEGGPNEDKYISIGGYGF